MAGSASSTWCPRSAARVRGFPKDAQGLRLDRGAVRGPGGEGDAQPARIGTDLVEEWASRRRRAVGIAGPGAARRVQDRGAVAHAQGDRVLGGKPAAPLAEIGRHGVAAAGRLEADESAAGGRGPDRAEAVRGVRRGQHARSDRGGRAAARSAGDAGRVPGVLRRPVQLRLAGEAEPQLAGVGPPEDDHAGPLQPLDVLAVLGRHDVFEEPAPSRGRAAREGGAEVLEEIRHALERTVWEAVRDSPAAQVVEPVGDCVDDPVARIDPSDGGLQNFLRGGLTPRDQSGQSERVVLFVVREGGHPVSLSMW